jgi:hypothetical protein
MKFSSSRCETSATSAVEQKWLTKTSTQRQEGINRDGQDSRKLRNADFGLRIEEQHICFSFRNPQSEIRNRLSILFEFNLNILTIRFS